MGTENPTRPGFPARPAAATPFASAPPTASPFPSAGSDASTFRPTPPPGPPTSIPPISSAPPIGSDGAGFRPTQPPRFSGPSVPPPPTAYNPPSSGPFQRFPTSQFPSMPQAPPSRGPPVGPPPTQPQAGYASTPPVSFRPQPPPVPMGSPPQRANFAPSGMNVPQPPVDSSVSAPRPNSQPPFATMNQAYAAAKSTMPPSMPGYGTVPPNAAPQVPNAASPFPTQPGSYIPPPPTSVEESPEEEFSERKSMGAHGAVKVAKTVLEVADVAWSAVEFRHHRHDHHGHESVDDESKTKTRPREEDVESLKSENRRLRSLLEENLKLLQNVSESPCLLNECPPDLYARLVAAVDSEEFLTRMKSLQQASVNGTVNEFPFKEATAEDVGILVNMDQKEPSWWVWVTEDMFPSNVEEWSGIDDENYVVVSEEQVVDGVANFMAKCIVSNPKATKMAPEELQKNLVKALGGESKLERILNIWHAGTLLYALSTWGLALAGLYQSRAVLRIAAKGVHTTSKVVMRAL